MSWTSEFEPPPPRPILEPEDFSEQGFDLVELDEPDAVDANEGPSADSLDEDGPLDPSVFDGLFDDLDGETRSGRADDSSGGETGVETDASDQDAALDDFESDTEFEDTPDDVDGVEGFVGADVDLTDEDLDLTDDGPLPDGPALDTDAGYDTDAEFEEPIDDGLIITDSHRVDGLLIKSDAEEADELPDQQTDGDEADEPSVAPQDAVTLDDAVPFGTFDEDLNGHDDDDVVDSSEELLHDVIRQNPGVTDPSPEHLDSEHLDAERLDSQHLDAEPFNPAATQHFGQAGPGQPPAPLASGFEPAPSLPPIVHYDPAVTDDAVDDSGYGTNGSAAEIQQVPVADNGGQLIDGHGYDQAAVAGYPSVGASPQVITNPPVVGYTAPKQRKRWPAFLMATIVGATVGVVGALLLFQMFRPDSTDPVEPAAEAPVDTTVDAAPNTTATPEADPQLVVGLANLASTGRFELNTIRFESGSVRLTEQSEAVLVEAAEAMAAQSPAPLAIEVRTFSEPTAAANRELSIRQADVLRTRLVELGVPAEAIMITALGPAQFDPSHPVQNFVVPSSGLEPSEVRQATEATSPFAIGLDPVTNQLRPESILPLSVLGEAMSNNDASSLSLAAYSFDQAGRDRNQEMAAVAAEAAAAFLVTNHGIDRNRISILTPGETPYVVGAEVGSHVYLQWGEWAEISQRLNAVGLNAVEFAPGSNQLTPEAVAALDQVVALSSEVESTLVVSVHSATESSDDANERLSAIQAESLYDYLVASGIPEERVRAYGAGNLRRYEGSDRQSAITITALP